MNVLLIDIDSLRFDHVGAYGYDAPTTPNIDELSSDATLFENAYVSNSPCLPSRAAWISGRYGVSNGVATHGPDAQLLRSPQNWRQWYACWAEEWKAGGRQTLTEVHGESKNWLTLPEVFFHNRVHTGAVSSFPRHTAPWFYHLWHEYHQPQEPDEPGEYMQTPRAETICDIGIDYLERHVDDSFFLYLQFWDPHTPYNRSEDEIEPFRTHSRPEHPTSEQLESHQEWDSWRSPAQLGISDESDLATLIAHYDAEIRHADKYVGRILQYLRDRDVYDDTMIILMADHGEEFGEHGVYREHWSTYEGTQHVPLLVKPPNQTRAKECDQLVTNVDIAPTILDYAGFEIPNGWQGSSLKPLITGQSEDWRSAIVFDHGLYTAQRAIRTNRWKLIRTYHPGMWDGVLPRDQLFDLENDPWEQENILMEYPDVAERLTKSMALWVENHVGRNGDPLRTVARKSPPGSELQQRWNEWSGV